MDRSILKDNQPDHHDIMKGNKKKGRMTMLSETINSQDRETSMSSVTEGEEEEGSSSDSNSENDSSDDDESFAGSNKDGHDPNNEDGSSGGGGGHMIQQRKGQSWGASNPLGVFLFLKIMVCTLKLD